MFEKFTVKAKRSIILARDAVETAGGEYLKTEHLLLGVLRLNEDTVLEILEKLEVGEKELMDEVELAIPRAKEAYQFSEIPFSHNATACVELAVKASEELNHYFVNSVHMLLGLVSVETCTAARILKKFGVTREKIISATLE